MSKGECRLPSFNFRICLTYSVLIDVHNITCDTGVTADTGSGHFYETESAMNKYKSKSRCQT